MMKGRWIKYSQNELDFIQAHSHLTRREATDAFNKKFKRDLRVSNIASLCKRNGWLTGRDGRFQKGNIPSPHARPKGPSKTTFKKGHVPENHLPVGTERITKDDLVQIKIAEPNIWRSKHRIVWEKVNGPMPKGHIIIFADGNNRNFDIDNLVLVSRAENLELNRTGYRKQPGEFKPSALLLAKIKVKARSKAK